MNHRLRLLRESDLALVMQWRMQPDVTRYMYTDPALTLEGQRRWFDGLRRSGRDVVWVIEQGAGEPEAGTPDASAPQAPGRPIGLLSLSGIDRLHSRCAWAYYLGEADVRGGGLARMLELNVYAFVFDTLGLNKLCCEVLAFNDRVVALHEKFGAKVEGVLRQHICKHGQYHDLVLMAMLREDWPAVRERFGLRAMDIESPQAWLAPPSPAG